ncbi:MAG: transporter substrate-binding domain-containing protein [Myxococcota bacterium]
MSRVSRALFVLLVLLGGLALTGCQTLRAAAPAAAGSRPIDRVLASGELRVGLSGNQPPLNMKNRKGEIIGFEADLARTLAESMGLEVRFVVLPFADLLSALEGGDVDLVASGMTITPDRNARVAFAGPYLVSGKSLLTRSEALSNAESLEVLDDPTRTYAALEASTSENFVRGMLPKAKLVTTGDYDSAVQMVIDDEVDALIADFPICALSILRFPDAGLSRHHTPFTIEPLGIALPPDSPLMTNLVQNYLRTLDDTGILTNLKAKWFSPGDWIAELP